MQIQIIWFKTRIDTLHSYISLLPVYIINQYISALSVCQSESLWEQKFCVELCLSPTCSNACLQCIWWCGNFSYKITQVCVLLYVFSNLLIMNFHMTLQTIWTRAGVITFCTSVGLFSGMCPHMSLQTTWLRTRVITLSACEGLFSSMDSHMCF